MENFEAEYQLAYAKGVEKGAESVRNRVAAVTTAEQIRGNGSRMTAAVELALESPDMATGKIVDLVVRTIPAAQPPFQDVCGSTTSWDGLSWSAFRESRDSGGSR